MRSRGHQGYYSSPPGSDVEPARSFGRTLYSSPNSMSPSTFTEIVASIRSGSSRSSCSAHLRLDGSPFFMRSASGESPGELFDDARSSSPCDSRARHEFPPQRRGRCRREDQKLQLSRSPLREVGRVSVKAGRLRVAVSRTERPHDSSLRRSLGGRSPDAAGDMFRTRRPLISAVSMRRGLRCRITSMADRNRRNPNLLAKSSHVPRGYAHRTLCHYSVETS